MQPKEYGLYAIALIPPLMINLFQDWDINPAMTKYIAHHRATNKTENIHNIIKAGLTFKLTTGATIFLATYILTAPTIGAVTQTDIKNLRTMLSDLGIITKLINIPLTLAEKVSVLQRINRK